MGDDNRCLTGLEQVGMCGIKLLRYNIGIAAIIFQDANGLSIHQSFDNKQGLNWYRIISCGACRTNFHPLVEVSTHIFAMSLSSAFIQL